jgi:hypothetical protein
MSVSVPVPCCFCYYSLIAKFEIRYCHNYSITGFIQDSFVYSGPFIFYMNFRILSFTSANNIIGTLKRIALST